MSRGRAAVLIGLLVVAIGTSGAATARAQPLQPLPVGPTLPVTGSAPSSEAVRQALELERADRLPEAIQKFRLLYNQSGDPSLLLNIMRMHRRAGDSPGVLRVYEEYEHKNPQPSAAVRRQLVELWNWANQPLETRNRRSAPPSHPPAVVLSGSGPRPRAHGEGGLAAAEAERGQSFGPPKPDVAPPPPLIGPPWPLTAAAVPPPLYKLPRWGKIVLGVVGSSAAIAIATGVGVYLAPPRDYTVYRSAVHQ